jgi:hypothetical protein
MLLRTLVKNKKMIFFPQPKYLGPTKLDDLKKFIVSVPSFVVVNEPTISLSNQAKLVVEQIANETEKEMSLLSHKIGSTV